MTGSRYEPGNAGGRPREGVEAPLRPVLSGRRGARQRLGLIVVASVAITVLAAGIGLGGSGLVPGPGPSGSSPAPSGSNAKGPPPTPQEVRSPRPTAMNSSGCIPVDPADLPRFRIGSSTGTRPPVYGMTSPPPGGDEEPSATIATSAWPVPQQGSALILESSAAVVVLSEDEACVRYVVAEYLAVEDIGGVPTNLGVGEIDVFPPRQEVVLESVPIGDWIVRVVVYYSTGVAGDEDKAVLERFFRVTTDVNPAVSPEITPTVPCTTLAPEAALGLSLQIGDGAPVPGVDLDTYQGDVTRTGALVEGPLSGDLILTVDGDVCATSWRVQWLDSSGAAMFEVIQENRTENPYVVSQNRIVLTPDQDVFGHLAIKADLELGLGRSVSFAWELERAGPTLPPIQVRGPDGQTALAVPGCGAGWTFADGRSTYEMCETSLIPETVRLLTIRSGDVVDILDLGMPVLNWSVSCGRRFGLNGLEFEYSSCDLGGGTAGPMRFLPFPGRWMFQLYISMEVDGDHFYAPYFVEILVEE